MMTERTTLRDVLTCVIAVIIFVCQSLVVGLIAWTKKIVKREEKAAATNVATANTIISSDSGPNDNNDLVNFIRVGELIQKHFDIPLIHAEDGPRLDDSLNQTYEERDEFMDRLIDDSYVARGLGLIAATVGRPAEFYLYSKYGDDYENIEIGLRGRDGDAGAVTIAPGRRRDRVAAGPKSIAVDYARDEDRMKITYTPRAEGVHVLTLSRDGVPVCRSPYYVSVDKTAASPHARPRVRPAARKYGRTVARFARGKQHAPAEDNGDRAVTTVRRGPSETDCAGTDVMSMVTKFESNGTGFENGRRRRMSDISENIAENDQNDEHATDAGAENDSPGLANTEEKCSDRADVGREDNTASNRKNDDHENTSRKSSGGVLVDGNVSRRFQTFRTNGRSEGRHPIVDPDTDRWKNTNNGSCLKNKIPYFDDDDGRKTIVLMKNANALESVANDFVRARNVSAALADIVGKLANQVCEKCSEQVIGTLSELSEDSTPDDGTNEIRPRLVQLVSRPTRRTAVDVENDALDDTTTDERPNTRLEINSSTTCIDRADDATYRNITRQSLDGREQRVDNGPEQANSANNDVVGRNNGRDGERVVSCEASEENTTSTPSDEYDIKTDDAVHQERSPTADEIVLRNCCSINDERYVNTDKDHLTVNIGDDSNPGNNIEWSDRNTQKPTEENTDQIKPNRCDVNIKEESDSTSDGNCLITNIAENTDEPKVSENKTIPNEGSKFQDYVIDDAVLDSVDVTSANPECKELYNGQQINDIFKTDGRNISLTTDVNRKLIIERSIEPELNSFKNKMVEKILLLCLNKNYILSNAHHTSENDDTKPINDSCESLINHNTNSTIFHNTENKNKQTEIDETLATRDLSGTISDTKKTDHLLKRMKNMILSENHTESMIKAKLQEVVNTTMCHLHDEQNDFMNCDGNQDKNTVLQTSTTNSAEPSEEVLEDEREDSMPDNTSNGRTSIDVKTIMEETPVTLELHSPPRPQMLDRTETITTNDEYPENIETEQTIPLSNVSETVENVENTIQQQDASNSSTLNVSETFTVETVTNDSNDSMTAAIELTPTLKRLLNVSRLATLKIPSPKEVDTTVTETDDVGKSNTADTKITYEKPTTTNNDGNIVINKSNTTEIETINETVEHSNDFEIKIWSPTTPITNDTKTIVIEIPNTRELKTTTETPISNEQKNIKELTTGGEARFKLSSSIDATQIVIIKRQNSDEINIPSNTLVSNRPVIITIEIVTDTNSSNEEIIINKSNITIPLTAALKESYDGENKTIEIDGTSENLILNSNVPVKETTELNIDSTDALIISNCTAALVVEETEKMSSNQIIDSIPNIPTDIPKGAEIDTLKNPEPKNIAVDELVEGKEIESAYVTVMSNDTPKYIENKIVMNTEPDSISLLNGTDTVAFEKLNTVETELVTNSMLPSETQTIENLEQIKIETTPEPLVLNEKLAASVEEAIKLEMESVEAPIISDYTIAMLGDEDPKKLKSEKTSTTLVLNNTLTEPIKGLPKKIEILQNDLNIVAFEKPNIAQIELTIDNLISNEAQVLILEELQGLKMETTSEPPVFNDNSDIPVDEAIKLEMESVDASIISKYYTPTIIFEDPKPPKSEQTLTNSTMSSQSKPIESGINTISQNITSDNIDIESIESDEKIEIDTISETTMLSNDTPDVVVDDTIKMKVEAVSATTLSNDTSSENPITIHTQTTLVEQAAIEIDARQVLIVNDNPDEQTNTEINNSINDVIIEVPNTVETEVTTENAMSNDTKSITVKEPEEVVKEPTLINYNPVVLVEVPNVIETVSENANDTTIVELKVTETDTASKSALSSSTRISPIEEPKKIEMYIVSDPLDTINHTIVRVEEETIAVEIKSISSTAVSNDTPPTTPVELQKVEIALENLLDDNNSVIENTVTNKTQEILEADPKIIETINDGVPITNYPLSLTVKDLEDSEENQVDLQICPFVKISNYTHTVTTEVENKIQIETGSETLPSDTDIVTVEEPITAKPELTTDDLILNMTQSERVEETDKVELDIMSTSLISNNNSTVQVEETPENELETVSLIYTTDLFEKNRKKILITEETLTTPILNSISNVSTDLPEKIDTTPEETSILNNNPPISVEEINEIDNIITTTETLIANDTSTKVLIKLTIGEADTTLKPSVPNDTIAELVKAPHEIHINTSSQVQISNTPDVTIEELVEIKNDYLSTVLITNNVQTEQKEEPKEIKTNILPEILLNDTNTSFIKEPNTVETGLSTEMPISSGAQSVSNEETNKVEIETTRNSSVSNDNHALSAEKSIELEKETVSATILSNDIPDTFVEDPIELETQEKSKTPVQNNTPAVQNNVQKNIEIDSTPENSILNDCPSELLKGTNELEIETVSLAKSSNCSTEQKEMENVSETIVSNDRPPVQTEKPIAMENKIVLGYPISDDDSTIVIKKLEAMEIDTYKCSNDNKNIQMEESKRVEIDITSELPVLTNNTAEPLDENAITEKIKPESSTIISDDEVIPVEDVQNINVEIVPETLLNDTNIVIKNTVANSIQEISEKELNKIETLIETPVTNDSLDLIMVEPNEVEEAKQVDRESITALSNDTLKIQAEVENEIDTETDCETLPNESDAVILEEPKTVETELTTDNLIIGTQSATVEQTERVEIEDTSKSNNNLPVSTENIDEMDTDNITEDSLSNNTSAETLITVNIGEIDSMTNISVLNDDTQTELQGESNQVKINNTLSQTLISNDTPPNISMDETTKTENKTVFATMITNDTLIMQLEESKSIIFDFEISPGPVEESKEIETKTVLTSSNSSNTPGVLVEQEPKETETDLTLETFLSNDVVVEPIDVSKKINRQTVPVTLLTNNYSDSLEESNLTETDIILTAIPVSSDPQNVFAEKANKVEIETTRLTSNDTPTTPIEECNVEGIDTLAEKTNDAKIRSEEEIQTALDATLLNFTSAEWIDEPVDVESMFEQFIFDNTETITEETEFISKTPLSNKSDADVVNIQKAVDMNNATCEAPTISKSERVTDESISVKTECLDDTQRSNCTSTVSTDDIFEVTVPKSGDTNCDFAETALVETRVARETLASSKPANEPNDVERDRTINLPVIDKSKTVVEDVYGTQPTADDNNESENNDLLTVNVRVEIADNTSQITENVCEQNDVACETANDTANVTVEESIAKTVNDAFETTGGQSCDNNNMVKTISNEIPNVCDGTRNVRTNDNKVGTDESTVPSRFSVHGETSKHCAADDNRLREESYGIRTLEMSVQRVKASDDDYIEETFVQLERTEKIAARKGAVVDDENETSVDDESYTVNESDLNAILCASSLQEALTVLDSKIKLKFKNKTRNSSNVNSTTFASSRQTSSTSSSDGRNSNFTEAQEFFKTIERKSQK